MFHFHALWRDGEWSCIVVFVAICGFLFQRSCPVFGAFHPHSVSGLVAIQDSVDGVVACLQANLMFFVFRLCVATGEHSDAAEEDSGEREEVLFHKDICL